MAFKKTFKVSDENVNTHGFWVRTAGIRLDAARINCPAYYEHRTWEPPIGHWENIRLDGTDVLADFVSDGLSENELLYIKKIENGDIKGASIGADPITWSDDVSLIKPGQTRPCVYDCELFEISLTPLPSNKSALALRMKGNLINLSADAANEKHLPLLKPIINMKAIALKLGMLETANENEILEKIGALQLQAGKTEQLQKELTNAHTDGLSDDDKDVFITLAKTDMDKAVKFARKQKETALENAAEPVAGEKPVTLKKDTTVTSLIQKGKNVQLSTQAADADKDCYDYLQKYDPVELSRIHKQEPEKYAKLAKEYGQGKRYAGK